MKPLMEGAGRADHGQGGNRCRRRAAELRLSLFDRRLVGIVFRCRSAPTPKDEFDRRLDGIAREPSSTRNRRNDGVDEYADPSRNMMGRTTAFPSQFSGKKVRKKREEEEDEEEEE